MSKHGVTLRDAWGFTMGEFFAVIDIDAYIHAKPTDGWDKAKLADFEEHLRKMGYT